MLHGDSPPGSGACPPRSLRPKGLGAPGETFPSVPKIRTFSETYKGTRPHVLQLAPVKGGSHMPPTETGGLLDAPTIFPVSV